MFFILGHDYVYEPWRVLSSKQSKIGTGFTEELQHWFDFPISATIQPARMIVGFLNSQLSAK